MMDSLQMALGPVRCNSIGSICAAHINTSSIMVGNAASSMSRNPQSANAD